MNKDLWEEVDVVTDLGEILDIGPPTPDARISSLKGKAESRDWPSLALQQSLYDTFAMANYELLP